MFCPVGLRFPINMNLCVLYVVSSLRSYVFVYGRTYLSVRFAIAGLFVHIRMSSTCVFVCAFGGRIGCVDT